MPKVTNEKLNFHIISMATYGHGFSGGDRIWIELSKVLIKTCSVNVYVWEEGRVIAQREKLTNVNYILWSAKLWSRFGFFINYFARIIIAVCKSLALKLRNSPSTLIYSASEFWQDVFPAAILKLRYRKVVWVASWYQTAPNPLIGFSEGNRKNAYKMNALFYWLAQLISKPLILYLADKVIVNNESERKQFKKHNEKGNVFVMLGAVRLDEIDKYISNHYLKVAKKQYDAVFQGRFHPQKGVVELIDVWKKVVTKKPEAKLAMIGDGPLRKEVETEINKLKLGNNIELFGYVFDGIEKYKIFSQSKIVVHPAFYDSGGMAAAEAMAFGIPAVGFNLESYKSYYPNGMVKVPVGDLDAFAKEILNLLNKNKLREQMGIEARKMIIEKWSWRKRADDFIRLFDTNL